MAALAVVLAVLAAVADPPPLPSGPHVDPPPPQPVIGCANASWPMCDTRLSVDERVSDFMSALTVADKMQILGQNTAGTRDGHSLWGSRGYNFWTEDLHGLRVGCPRRGPDKLPFGRCATQFPEANALGCSFNASLFAMVGDAIATEDRVYYTYACAPQSRSRFIITSTWSVFTRRLLERVGQRVAPW